MQSEQIDKIAAAMVKVQAEIGPAVKGKANPFFKSHYADLSEVWNACRGALQSNGIAVIQGACVIDGKACMETKLVHTSGQWFSSQWEMMPAKNDPQAMGSAITYMRRYSLSSMVGVLSEDDDGNAASKPPDLSVHESPATNKPIATEESRPHRIPVPNLEDDTEKWQTWGQQFRRAIRTSKTPEEVDEWLVLHDTHLGNFKKFSEAGYAYIIGDVETVKDGLKGDG